MRLVRVQVPEFRALKNVDISFEPEFNPQVFPLGSLNGGGKSTLLQLIFILLNFRRTTPDSAELSFDQSYFKDFLSDLLNKSETKNGCSQFAIITILTNKGEKVEFEFVYGGCDAVNSFWNERRDQLDKNITSRWLRFLYRNSCFDLTIHFDNIEKENHLQTMEYIQDHIFLISPSNQSYLFATREERRSMYVLNPEKHYSQVLNHLKNVFPNFFTYDFIDVLTEVFRLARDKDYNERLKTGIYGPHTEQLEKTINGLFNDGKRIVPLTINQKRHTKDAIQSMGFKLRSGEEIYPEDLSHGELKRLTIFILLTLDDIHDSIVLMDEIESSFHLDWQYKIVQDLVEWEKTNQYILATHSYELCTAVTPAHVKELEPKDPKLIAQ